MEKLIDKMLCEEFTRFTFQDLNRPLDDPIPTQEVCINPQITTDFSTFGYKYN